MSPHHHRPAHPTIRVTSRPRPVVHDEQLMMPQATLRRGDRTILILGTIHHAHQAFYDQIARCSIISRTSAMPSGMNSSP